MTEVTLPEKVVSIDALRIARYSGKGCHCRKDRFVVDVDARAIECQDCGQRVDPFDALLRLTDRGEEWRRQTEALLEQRRQIVGWQPHLVALRELERHLRHRDMVPSCPHCHRGVLLEDFRHMGMTNREIEVARRKAESATPDAR